MTSPLSPERVAALASEPQFQAALRQFAAETVAAHHGNRLTNLFLQDRARVAASWLALHLHHQGGLTVNRFVQTCVALDLAGPARARAALVLMRTMGLLAAAAGTSRGLAVQLLPTPAFEALHRTRLLRLVRWVAAARPATAALGPQLGDPALLFRFTSDIAARVVAGERPIILAPVLRPFTQRQAGMLILLQLALLSGPESVSVSTMARQFAVSRAHVRALLRDAEAADLMLLSPGARAEHFQPTAALRDNSLRFFACLALILDAAAENIVGARDCPSP